MFRGSTMNGLIAFGVVFTLIWGAGSLFLLRLYRDKRRALARLRDERSGQAINSESNNSVKKSREGGPLPAIGALILAKERDRLEQVRNQLIKAGIYTGQAVYLYAGIKWVLMLVLPILFAFLPWLFGFLSLGRLPLVALSACAVGMWAPHFWLSSRVLRRQRLLRAAFPDALDMLVLCLEGGVSLTAAIQRVTDELQFVHGELGAEFNILQREIQLGLSAGEALKKLSNRCGLEEVRDLAATILQSEQYGASVAKTFRTYAEGYRVERHQHAEETAQKAAVKILFPTLLFIFPATFIVLLGPAAFQLSKIFSR
jgi:tight adherence protein C